MASSQKQESHNVSSNVIDPAQMAKYTDNYSGAQGRASTLTPYTGPLTAGFNPTQTQAQGILSNVALDPSYLHTANGATAGAQSVLDSNPLTMADLQQYMNPFQQSVIDATTNQNERAREIARNVSHMQDTHGAAFGGGRSGVADALTNEGYDRNSLDSLATLNSQNFGQAQNASLAAKNLEMNAANNVASLNNNALGVATNQGGILSAIGDTQQAQLQKQYTDAYNAYTQGQNLTLMQQQLLNQALGIIPIQQTQTSDGTTKTTSNPGAMGIISGIGSLALAAGTGGASMGLTGLLGAGKNTLSAAMPYLQNGTGGLGG